MFTYIGGSEVHKPSTIKCRLPDQFRPYLMPL